MLADQSFVPLSSLAKLFLILLVTGIVLTLPLYKFDWRKFIKSSLFIKIMFWILIFLVFLGILYASSQIRLTILIFLLVMIFHELFGQLHKSRFRTLLITYFLVLTIFIGHFYLIGTVYRESFVNIMITLAFATVLADVTAFFLGNYFGAHKLTAILNKNKSWEGVFGEIAGALAGVVLVDLFIEPVVSIWLFLPIGAGAVIGDLTNSYIKRKLDIKDWSGAIPGHGGFVDRLSSIAGSAILTFYFLRVTGLL